MSRTNQLLELTQSFLALLNNSNWNSPVSRLDSLKKRILFEGIPSSPQESALIRPQIWKLLLNLQELQLMNAKVYYDLTNRKTSNMFSKIKNDSFRTLASDSTFLGKVSEEDIVRLLEAFVWRQIGKFRDLLSHRK
jgi:cell cycle arrest protein BUB2